MRRVSFRVGIVIAAAGLVALLGVAAEPLFAQAESAIPIDLAGTEPVSGETLRSETVDPAGPAGPVEPPEFNVYRGVLDADEVDRIRFDLPLPGFLLVEAVPIDDPERTPVLAFEPLAAELASEESSATASGHEASDSSPAELAVRAQPEPVEEPGGCPPEASECPEPDGLVRHHLLAVAVGGAGSYELTVGEAAPDEALGVFKLMARFIAEEVAVEVAAERGEVLVPVEPEVLAVALETGSLGRLVLGGVIAERPGLTPGEHGPDDTPLIEIPDSSDPDWAGDVFTVTIIEPTFERPGIAVRIAADALEGLDGLDGYLATRRFLDTPSIDGSEDDLLSLLCPVTEIDSHGDLQLCAQPLTLAESATGRIENPTVDDVDVFEIRLGSRSRLRIEGRGEVDLAGSLFDSHGKRLAFDDDSGAERGFLIEERLDSGIYRLRVQAADGGEGDYEVLVEAVEGSIESESESTSGSVDPGEVETGGQHQGTGVELGARSDPNNLFLSALSRRLGLGPSLAPSGDARTVELGEEIPEN